MDTIGAILKRRIKECGYTQEEFADKVGISYSSLKKYMNGTTKYDVELLQRFAKELNCSYEYLLGETITPSKEYRTAIEETHLSESSMKRLNQLANSESIYDGLCLSLLNKIITHKTLLISMIMYLGLNKRLEELKNKLVKMVFTNIQIDVEEMPNADIYINSKSNLMFFQAVVDDINEIGRTMREEILDSEREDINILNERIDEYSRKR